ncbi:MAG: S26 family signal peptidase [Planctomycetes bacterium]|nr:S26 family signal peptidase [Planctomycetota bacterium]
MFSKKILIVNGQSMAPTLLPGQILWVTGGTPSPGDLAVFCEPDSGKTVVKRCMAVGGNQVLVIDNSFHVNSSRVTKPVKKITDLSPRWIVDDAQLGKTFDVDTSELMFNGSGWISPASPQEIKLRSPTINLGHALEAQASLLSSDSRFSLNIRRGMLTFSLEIVEQDQKWYSTVSGGTLPRAKRIASGKLSSTTGSQRLMLSLANNEFSAFVNGQQAGASINLNEFDNYCPPTDFVNEQLAIKTFGQCRFSKVRVASEINYQVDGNYGAGAVFRVNSDELYFLGDNTTQSRDSRHYGSIDKSQIIGVATRLWPRDLDAKGWPLE